MSNLEANARACAANHERCRSAQIRPAINMPPGRSSASAAYGPISRTERPSRPIQSMGNKVMEVSRSTHFDISRGQMYEPHVAGTIGRREIQRFTRVHEVRALSFFVRCKKVGGPDGPPTKFPTCGGRVHAGRCMHAVHLPMTVTVERCRNKNKTQHVDAAFRMRKRCDGRRFTAAKRSMRRLGVVRAQPCT